MAAGPNLSTHAIMGSYQTVSGNTPFTQAIVEAASQSFLQGTPVTLSSGYITACTSSSTSPLTVAGISLQMGQGLASNGASAPTGPYTQVGPPGGFPTYGKVDYQTSAVNLPLGAPMGDGRTYLEVANGDTIFLGQFDSSASTGAIFAPTLANIGTAYGLTADSNGYWYVDSNKTTVGTNTCVTLVGILPQDMAQPTNATPYPTSGINNARVLFKFQTTAFELA